MKDKAKFQQKLGELLEVAKAQGGSVTIEEVRLRLESDTLTEEQMNLVFDYLLAQKVVVKGYIKMDMPVSEEAQLVLTEDEEAYLKEYQEDLKAFKPVTEQEREVLFEKMIKGEEDE